MRKTRTMLLGIVIALSGVGLAQPGNDVFLFKSLLFLPTDVFTVTLPVTSMLLILAGSIIGVVGYFQRNQE